MISNRFIIFFIFLGAFAASYQIGSFSEVNDEEARKFIEEFEELVKDIDAVGIFVHNLTIALPMFIPGFGVAWGLFSAWSTGYAFASIVSLTPELAGIPPLALLFLTPFGIMELAAYSIGISRSFILIKMIVKKVSIKPELKRVAIEVGIMAGLLLAGGFIEHQMIEMVQESGLVPQL